MLVRSSATRTARLALTPALTVPVPPPSSVMRARPASGRRRWRRARLVVEVGQRHSWQSTPDRLLDLAQAALFLWRDQRERRACRLGARRSADAVDVIVGHDWHVEVDDVPKR